LFEEAPCALRRRAENRLMGERRRLVTYAALLVALQVGFGVQASFNVIAVGLLLQLSRRGLVDAAPPVLGGLAPTAFTLPAGSVIQVGREFHGMHCASCSSPGDCAASASDATPRSAGVRWRLTLGHSRTRSLPTPSSRSLYSLRTTLLRLW
jgi:hypothetical protein